MRTRKFLGELGLSLLLAASFSLAADQAPDATEGADRLSRPLPMSRVFSVHDSNHDGLLSRAEYARFVEQVELRRQHRNQSRRQPLHPLRFEQIDSNQDGALNEDEMVSALNIRLRQQRRLRFRGERPQ